MGAETDRLRATDLRLVPVAAGCWAAAGAGVLHPDAAGLLAGIGWVAAAGLILGATALAR